MVKPSTIVAFVASMLITTFLTVTSYLGIALFTSLRRQTRYDQQWEAHAHEQLATTSREELKRVA
jgi:hypothetical protein